MTPDRGGPVSERPVRVRVTSPRAGRPRRTSVASEIDAQTAVGEIYMRSLVRTQLRLALGIVGVLAVTIGGLPLVFAIWPELGRVHVFGIPLPWLLLGGCAYPVLVTLAWVYARRAERNEADFRDLVRQ